MPPRGPRNGAQPPAASSWGLGRISETYTTLWKMIIRPPRDLYTAEELGPRRFRLGKRVCERTDMQLKGSRGLLECSHFCPVRSKPAAQEEGKACPPRPCVIYLHGNCSSRLEAFDVLPSLLSRGLSVFSLDLSGSGRSEGEYISLGHHEEKDLSVVIQHLRELGTVSAIALWGRSMGATTSILRCAEDHAIAACVLDSAFRDLRTVAEELVNRGHVRLPAFMLNFAFEIIRAEVVSRAAFDPAALAPIESARKAVCPAFFGVASDDCFVLPHHTEDLHNSWGGERDLRVFDGSHNGVRPAWFLEEAADFLMQRLLCKPGPRPQQSGEAPLLRTPSGGEWDSVPADRDPRSTEAKAVAPEPPSSREGMRLFQQLRYLGFPDQACQAASRRCLSVDAAVQWLTSQTDVTVHL